MSPGLVTEMLLGHLTYYFSFLYSVFLYWRKRLTSGYESLAKTWRRAVLPHCVSPTTTILQRSNPLLSIVARGITECSCVSASLSFRAHKLFKSRGPILWRISLIRINSCLPKLQKLLRCSFGLHALRNAAALLCSTGSVRRADACQDRDSATSLTFYCYTIKAHEYHPSSSLKRLYSFTVWISSKHYRLMVWNVSAFDVGVFFFCNNLTVFKNRPGKHDTKMTLTIDYNYFENEIPHIRSFPKFFFLFSSSNFNSDAYKHEDIRHI